MFLSLTWLLALLLSSSGRADDTPPPPVDLEVYIDVAATVPGEEIRLLAQVDIPKDWHIYWENPGNSGTPTQIEIHSKTDLQPSVPRWSAPEERLVLPGDVVNFAYTHQEKIQKISDSRADHYGWDPARYGSDRSDEGTQLPPLMVTRTKVKKTTKRRQPNLDIAALEEIERRKLTT